MHIHILLISDFFDFFFPESLSDAKDMSSKI